MKLAAKQMKARRVILGLIGASAIGLSVMAQGTEAHTAPTQHQPVKAIVALQMAEHNDAIVKVYYETTNPWLMHKIAKHADDLCVGFLNEDFSCSTDLPEGESSAITDRL